MLNEVGSLGLGESSVSMEKSWSSALELSPVRFSSAMVIVGFNGVTKFRVEESGMIE